MDEYGVDDWYNDDWWNNYFGDDSQGGFWDDQIGGMDPYGSQTSGGGDDSAWNSVLRYFGLGGSGSSGSGSSGGGSLGAIDQIIKSFYGNNPLLGTGINLLAGSLLDKYDANQARQEQQRLSQGAYDRMAQLRGEKPRYASAPLQTRSIAPTDPLNYGRTGGEQTLFQRESPWSVTTNRLPSPGLPPPPAGGALSQIGGGTSQAQGVSSSSPVPSTPTPSAPTQPASTFRPGTTLVNPDLSAGQQAYQQFLNQGHWNDEEQRALGLAYQGSQGGNALFGNTAFDSQGRNIGTYDSRGNIIPHQTNWQQMADAAASGAPVIGGVTQQYAQQQAAANPMKPAPSNEGFYWEPAQNTFTPIGRNADGSINWKSSSGQTFDSVDRATASQWFPSELLDRYYAAGGAVSGRGTGQSDDIPAMLSDGEYVLNATTVADIGDGSTEAGFAQLDKFVKAIQKHKGRKGFPAKAKDPMEYL